jgi:hypothetical protein
MLTGLKTQISGPKIQETRDNNQIITNYQIPITKPIYKNRLVIRSLVIGIYLLRTEARQHEVYLDYWLLLG